MLSPSGKNSAIAKTTDEGKDFDGIAIVNSNFNNYLTSRSAPTAPASMPLVYDGADTNLWSFKAGVMEPRVHTGYAAGTNWDSPPWAASLIPYLSAPEGGTTMYKSLDGGETWVIRACAAPDRRTSQSG